MNAAVYKKYFAFTEYMTILPLVIVWVYSIASIAVHVDTPHEKIWQLVCCFSVTMFNRQHGILVLYSGPPREKGGGERDISPGPPNLF